MALTPKDLQVRLKRLEQISFNLMIETSRIARQKSPLMRSERVEYLDAINALCHAIEPARQVLIRALNRLANEPPAKRP